MALPFALKPVTVVCGHYGAGKTNFALNLALDAAGEGYEVTLVDLDVVNPYFRSSEYRQVLAEAGVALVSPVFAEAGTNLDVPSLTGAIAPAVNRAYFDAAEGAGRMKTIVDVGGDDAGAAALARFAADIRRGPFDLLCVVNRFRNLTQTPAEALEVMREIEARCGLAATGVVGNSHLKAETDWDVVASGGVFAREVCAQADLPLLCATVPVSLARREAAGERAFEEDAMRYPVRMLVKSPWEQ